LEDLNLMSLRNIAAAATLGITLLFATGCNTEAPPVKKVASIDESVIYQMEMFKKAEEDLNKWADEKSKEMAKSVEGKSDEEKAKKYQEFQAALEIEQNKTMDPLKKKVKAAIESSADKASVTVVLDKKIIVYGVPDLTDQVKTLLESGAEITFPEDNQKELDKAPVGYFDPSVIRNLKVFKEAEIEVYQERDRLLRSMSEELEKAKNAGRAPSPAEIQAMQKAVEARLSALQEQKMAPLMKSVTDSVEEVARAEGLSLVLDTQHVMYGGRNLTELVVDSFLKRVGASKSAPAASPTPAGE
jgi:Skp family chaperone for outer membrane proteins